MGFFVVVFCLFLMPLAKQESVFADAKIKTGEYPISHMVDVTEHRPRRSRAPASAIPNEIRPPFRGRRRVCVCVFQACACHCSRAFFFLFFWNMCFRGSFSGGASAKDKGHRGHRERFFCSSGFQIIQGRGEGASRPSFSPSSHSSLLLLLNFPPLDRHICRLSSQSTSCVKDGRRHTCTRGHVPPPGPAHPRGCG